MNSTPRHHRNRTIWAATTWTRRTPRVPLDRQVAFGGAWIAVPAREAVDRTDAIVIERCAPPTGKEHR